MFQKVSTARPFTINQNWDFWFENVPSGNPATQTPLHIFQLPSLLFTQKKTFCCYKTEQSPGANLATFKLKTTTPALKCIPNDHKT
jgi:hypothetical protein